MGVGIIIYSVILTIIILILVGYLFYLKYYKRRKPTDYTIVRNTYMSQYTKGHAELLLIGSIKGNMRIGLELIPKDIPNLLYYQLRRRTYKIPEELLKPMIFWCPDEKIHRLPITSSSDYKNIIEIEPFSVNDIRESMKRTKLGQIMMTMVSANNKRKYEKEFLEGENSKLRNIINNNLIGEATSSVLGKLKAAHEDSLDIVTKEKDKKTPIFTPEHRPYP